MYEDTCKHCTRPITSDRGGPGALWWGHSTLRDDNEPDWCCDQHIASRRSNGYGKHEPEVLPDEIEAAIESIRKDA